MSENGSNLDPLSYEKVAIPWDEIPSMNSGNFMYFYNGKIAKIVDGDSYHIDIDFGMNITKKAYECRGFGYDTWETFRKPKGLSDEEWIEHKIKGKRATAIVDDLMPPGTRVLVLTARDFEGKYGRLLVNLYIPIAEGMYVDVTETLRKSGALKS